ncbi:MAG: alpha/beta hydrolase [Proteobacteria bacterium]|nr:alpha/beta hydrolase [Pseudomonadota bacterium]
MEPRQSTVQCMSPKGLHRIAYREWGDPANGNVLVCVHGLTRCARDFDTFAAAMADRYRVICPDVAGRGHSDWLPDPMLYGIPQYVADMVTLIARLDVGQVDWVGTSMGGIIGMGLAAQPNTPVRKLVVNDAGPVLTKVSLERIAAYVGAVPLFPDFGTAQQYVRAVSASFGPHTEDEWRFLTEVVVRKQPDGRYKMHYDPGVAEPFKHQMPEGNIELWPLYDAIRSPMLVLHGELSDLLTRETCDAMAHRGPRARVVEIPGVGHAPTLMHADQIGIVRNYLLEG